MGNKYDETMGRLNCHRIGAGDFTPPTAEDFQHFEQVIGYSLPGDYRAFLSKYGGTAGGGNTRFGNLDDPTQEESSVEVFYELRTGGRQDLLGKRESFGDVIPSHILPIASSPGGQIVLSLAGDDFGRLYWWSPHRGSADPYDDFELIAYDFDSFVNSLRIHEN